MMGKYLYIVLLLSLACLIWGCAAEPVPSLEGTTGIQLTVRCDNPILTKTETEEKDGEKPFNENLIKSVDFLFYPGSNPAADADAVYRLRKELTSDPMQPGQWEATFNLVIKKELIEVIFTDGNANKATVLALVNFDATFAEDLSLTSQADLAGRRIVLDFAQNEVDYIQPTFLMDGKTVVTYDPDATPNAVGDIEVKRFASKLTVALNLVDEVVLKHVDKGESTEPDEVWTPVPHTARIYLVDGIKSVLLSENGLDPNPEYFSYKNVSRPFIKENGTPQLETETIGEKTYYNTWPMYSFPAT